MALVNFEEVFKVLQLEPGISPELIKLQYRELILRNHPDHNNDANSSSLTSDIIEAYKLVSLLHASYCSLDDNQQESLLSTLNNTPFETLDIILTAYPQPSLTFNRHSLAYPSLALYRFTAKAVGAFSVYSNIFLPCITGLDETDMQDLREEEITAIHSYTKKNL